MHYVHFYDSETNGTAVFVGKTKEEANIPLAIFLLKRILENIEDDDLDYGDAIASILKGNYADAVDDLIAFQDVYVHDFETDDCESMTAEEAQAIVLSLV